MRVINTPVFYIPYIVTPSPLRKERKSDEIYLRASKDMEYQKVASILALVSNIGYSQISLVTDTE